jgi:hypothetical protein
VKDTRNDPPQASPPTEVPDDTCLHGVPFDEWCAACIDEMNAQLAAGTPKEPGMGPLW